MKKTTNYTTVRKKAKGVHMIHQNLLKKHQLDPIAEKVMACLEGKVSPMLYGHLMIAYDHNILKKGVRSKMNNIKGSI